MSSKVQICNRALARLAAKRISSLGDDTVESKLCNVLFDEVAEETMSMGPWPSCVKRATLAQLNDTPTYEFTYAYQLPVSPKCIRVLEINEDRLGDIRYKIEDGKLLTDESSVDIKYLAYITDTQSYDVYLRQAIIEKLVSEMAYQLTGQIKAAQLLVEQAEKKIDQLVNVACAQGSTDDLPSDTYIDVRTQS